MEEESGCSRRGMAFETEGEEEEVGEKGVEEGEDVG